MSAHGPYKLFPPGRGELLVPTSSRSAALAALAMFPACRPLAALAQRVAWTAVRIAGPAALPGRATDWRQPLPESTWEEIRTAWWGALGEWDQAAVLRHVQPGRHGLAFLLLRSGKPVAFAKLRKDEAPLARERTALEAVAALGPRSFVTPAPLAFGAVAGWHWLAVTPLPPRIHRPARAADIDSVLAEVDAALERLPRSVEVPADWRPMHGDLTPWNLRRVPGHGLALVDWEEAGWGPPGADRVLFLATEGALRGEAPAPDRHQEAVRYWHREVRLRGTDQRNQRLTEGLERALASMMATSGSLCFIV